MDWGFYIYNSGIALRNCEERQIAHATKFYTMLLQVHHLKKKTTSLLSWFRFSVQCVPLYFVEFILTFHFLSLSFTALLLCTPVFHLLTILCVFQFFFFPRSLSVYLFSNSCLQAYYTYFTLIPKKLIFPFMLFTWLIKINISLIVLFTCSRRYSSLRAQPPSFIRSATVLKRLASG